MRGARGYQELIAETKPTSTQRHLGRNPDMVAARNELIVTRYFFYARMLEIRMQYEDVIKRLSGEFFISTIQVTRIIGGGSDLLDSYKKKSPTLKGLTSQYPFFNWSKG